MKQIGFLVVIVFSAIVYVGAADTLFGTRILETSINLLVDHVGGAAS